VRATINWRRLFLVETATLDVPVRKTGLDEVFRLSFQVELHDGFYIRNRHKLST